jgi:uncharacterized membrane protein
MFSFKDFSENLSDRIATFIGSWKFIIIQSIILTIWIVINSLRLVDFDHYPFILLNLFLSFEAAYATPLILMSSNRSAERDRKHMVRDIELDQETNIVIKKVSEILNKVSADLDVQNITIEKLNIAEKARSNIQKELREIKRILNKKN